MINWQVVGQLIALALIVLSGPAIISFLAINKAEIL